MLLFLGITAVLGGIELTFGLWMSAQPPGDWLDAIPLIDSWVLPGLVLGAGFGVGSLVAAYGMLRRPRTAWPSPVERLTGRHWSWAMTELLGLGMLAWIGLEVVYLPERSWLEALYGGVGVALALLPTLPSVRRYLLVAPSRRPGDADGATLVR
ncbi:hypothetical protein ODJ79_37620 [Actinoplanes sp. KI2]|uniref:hypothetical protein n=1 Tax=Actinoplanes sp. KI2 TaxID=2983315 RepID=UPI0021D5FB6F|nr:hypothetical protein [Actinoplanes sp. KI2]MCU7729469.1 hypothetical protein [Actinoplanes sp. KI2]